MDEKFVLLPSKTQLVENHIIIIYVAELVYILCMMCNKLMHIEQIMSHVCLSICIFQTEHH
jgi:hypothetical protein